MSSSGITSINSGPLIIRTYYGNSPNNTYILGTNDIPVSSNMILITSTNGFLTASNNINISSITVSSIVSGCISSNQISTSSLLVSSINGIAPISSGTYYSDYLYWNNNSNSWQVGSSTIHIGSFAGYNQQETYAIAIGFQAASTLQDINAIAIGNTAGQSSQNEAAIAIGRGAGQINQQANAIAIGQGAGNLNQQINSIAIGFQAGETNQSTQTIIINATGFAVDTDYENACYIAPIRGTTTSNYGLLYNPLTYEITYGNTMSLPQVLTSSLSSDPGSSGWPNFFGKSVFVSSNTNVNLTLPVTSINEGTTIKLYNTMYNSTVSTFNSFPIGSSTIIGPSTAVSFVFSQFANNLWFPS